MLELVVLFTIFIGLVGVLYVIGVCQRRRHASAEKRRQQARREALDKVKGWLAGHGMEVPSPQQITALLNHSLQQTTSKEWREVKLEDLSLDSSLPSFTITSLSSQDKNKIQFECKLEGLPSVGVACVNEVGERVSCCVEVEWLYAMMQVTLRVDEGKLFVSVHHTEPVKMSLSCAAQGSPQDAERVSSSVADDLQIWFSSLTINDAPLPSLIPSLLVSNHDSQEEVELTTPIETPPPLANEVTADQSIEPPLSATNNNDNEGVAPEPTIEEKVKDQVQEEVSMSEGPSLVNGGHRQNQNMEVDRGGMNGDSQSIGRQNSGNGQPPEEIEHVLEEGMHPLVLTSVREEEEGERGGSRCEDNGLPTSPSWRRSPSYEQLQQISLDPHRLVQSTATGLRVSPPHSSDRRTLTLSVSGSEAESIYGADERIPSTLVFEVMDSPDKLRHIVAVTPVHAVKLRRKYPHAKKLHIYNDHCFTATHIKKRMECSVCGSKISGLFGKQAYTCQDCTIVVHKHCHFKVEGQCSKTQLQHMNLIYPDNTSTASAN